MLTARLKGFLQAGVMELDPRQGSEQPRDSLTDKGRDLAPVIVALTAWGDRWAAPDGPPVASGHPWPQRVCPAGGGVRLLRM